MKYPFLVLLFPVLVWACSKPDIYIPVNDNKGPTGINDLSQVYIFFQVNNNGDTVSDMHKNQIISSTHFVVHIDRRLPVRTLINDLNWLYRKRHKKSIHNVPGKHLFFSHVDSVSNRIRLNPFDSLQIISPFYRSGSYVKKNNKSFEGKHLIHTDLTPEHFVVAGRAFRFPEQKSGIASYLYRLTGQSKSYIALNVNYHVRYERYNDLYGFLVHLDSNRVVLLHEQFWYNPKELP